MTIFGRKFGVQGDDLVTVDKKQPTIYIRNFRTPAPGRSRCEATRPHSSMIAFARFFSRNKYLCANDSTFEYNIAWPEGGSPSITASADIVLQKRFFEAMNLMIDDYPEKGLRVGRLVVGHDGEAFTVQFEDRIDVRVAIIAVIEQKLKSIGRLKYEGKDSSVELSVLSLDMVGSKVIVGIRVVFEGNYSFALDGTIAYDCENGGAPIFKLDPNGSAVATLQKIASFSLPGDFAGMSIRNCQWRDGSLGTPPGLGFDISASLWKVSISSKNLLLTQKGDFLWKPATIHLFCPLTIQLGSTPFMLSGLGGTYNVDTRDMEVEAQITITADVQGIIIKFVGTLGTNLGNFSYAKAEAQVLLFGIPVGRSTLFMDFKSMRGGLRDSAPRMPRDGTAGKHSHPRGRNGAIAWWIDPLVHRRGRRMPALRH